MMKRSFLLSALFLISFWLSACAGDAQSMPEAWNVYHAASDTLVNPNFLPYSFEYPSDWRVEEGVNHITFVSEAELLQNPPERLGPGQIIAGLSLNVRMAPEEIVESYTSSLASMIQFEEIVSVRLNGHPAAYQEGLGLETGDAVLILAVDMGQESRGLLTARMARSEQEKWEEILFKMAGSLQVEQ